jgi:hypothetical protein
MLKTSARIVSRPGEHEEEVVGVVVLVPDELALHLDDGECECLRLSGTTQV